MSNLIECIPAHVREYLETQDSAISHGVDFIAGLDSDESFIAADAKLEAVEKSAGILRGFLYIRYRETCDGRNFLVFLAKRGIPQRTAYDYMDEARVYAQLPNASACATVGQIGQGKTRLLAKLGQDAVNAFLAGEPVLGFTVDDAIAMTKEDFKDAIAEYKHSINAEIQDLYQKNHRLSTDLELATYSISELNEKLDQKFSDLPFPPWVSAAREEAIVHGDTAERALSGLSLALDQVRKHTDASLKGDQLAEYRAAAAHVYYQLTGILQRVNTLINDAHSFIPDDVVGHFDMSLPLTAAELNIREEHRQRISGAEAVTANARAKNRAAKNAGRGRPAGHPATYPE